MIGHLELVFGTAVAFKAGGYGIRDSHRGGATKLRF